MICIDQSEASITWPPSRTPRRPPSTPSSSSSMLRFLKLRHFLEKNKQVFTFSDWSRTNSRMLQQSLRAVTLVQSKLELDAGFFFYRRIKSLDRDLRMFSVGILSVLTNQRPVFELLDLSRPIRGQYSGHVICLDQSEASTDLS